MQHIKFPSLPFLWAVTLACLLSMSFHSLSLAQNQEQTFKVGDRVEADINMSSSAKNTKWRKATITKIEMWQGKVSGYFIKTDEGTEHVSAARFMRPIIKEEKKDEPKPKPTNRPTDRDKTQPPAKATPAQKTGGNPASKPTPITTKHRAKGCPLGPSRQHYQDMLKVRWHTIHEREYGDIKITFDSFEILKPIKWTNPYARAVNTTVYPVKTKYKIDLTRSTPTFYKHVVTAYDSLIYFYKDTRGECTFDVVKGVQGKNLVYKVR